MDRRISWPSTTAGLALKMLRSSTNVLWPRSWKRGSAATTNVPFSRLTYYNFPSPITGEALIRWFGLTRLSQSLACQDLQELGHKVGQVGPATGGDQGAVDHHRLIDEHSSG